MQKIVFGVALCAACTLVASDAFAQQDVGMARYGQRYITLGYSAQPGLTWDDDAPPTSSHRDVAATWGSFAKVGLHHLVQPRFVMAGEVDLGVQWMDEHTVALGGVAKSERVFAWQLGLVGRFMPSGDHSGLGLGMGLGFTAVNFDVAPYRGLSLDARVSWTVWRDSHTPRFAMVEVGWGVPVVAGLQFPPDFILEGMNPPEVAEQNWHWSRGVVAIQMSL